MSFRENDSDEKSVKYIYLIYQALRSLNRFSHFEMTKGFDGFKRELVWWPAPIPFLIRK